MYENYNPKIIEKIYHELGHLIVDILITQKRSQYQIVKFIVSDKYDSKICFNKNLNVYEDKEIASITYISLLFGSILESAYLFNNGNIYSEPMRILNFRSTGGDDLAKIIKLNAHYFKVKPLLKKIISDLFNLLIEDKKIFLTISNYVSTIARNLEDDDNFCYYLETEMIEKVSKDLINDEELKNLYKCINNSKNKVYSMLD